MHQLLKSHIIDQSAALHHVSAAGLGHDLRVQSPLIATSNALAALVSWKAVPCLEEDSQTCPDSTVATCSAHSSDMVEEDLQYVILQAEGVEWHCIAKHIQREGCAASAVNGQAVNRYGSVAQAAKVHLHLTQHLLMLSMRLQG